MGRVRPRLLAYLTALWSCLLAALAVLTVGSLALSPLLGWFLTRKLPVLLRIDLRALIWLAWIATTTVSVRAIRAIRCAKIPRLRIWTDEIKADRQPSIAELVRGLRSSGARLPGGDIGVCLAFPIDVDWMRTGRWGTRRGVLLLGMHAIAGLSKDEVLALAVKAAFQVFEPPSPLHAPLIRLHMRVVAWRSVIPPDEGFPSLAHKLLEWLESISKPIAPQSDRWGLQRAKEIVPAETLLSAQRKMMFSGVMIKTYLDLYFRALASGGVPPFTDGLYQLLKKKMTPVFDAGDPFYLQLDGLWVHEQRFVRALLGQTRPLDLRMASWDDLLVEIGGEQWKDVAVGLRPHLTGRRVNDLPELVREWRSVTRMFAGSRVPAVTPDVLRQLMINSLGAVFAVVLLEAGWENNSQLGEESTFRKNGRELRPFELLNAVGAGRMPPEEFAVRCREVAGLELW